MPTSYACAIEEILLWIHEGLALTVWPSVPWTDHFGLYLKGQSDSSMRDNRVGVVRWAAIAQLSVGFLCACSHFFSDRAADDSCEPSLNSIKLCISTALSLAECCGALRRTQGPELSWPGPQFGSRQRGSPGGRVGLIVREY
jgi:hypothetical protein